MVDLEGVQFVLKYDSCTKINHNLDPSSTNEEWMIYFCVERKEKVIVGRQRVTATCDILYDQIFRNINLNIIVST